MLSDTTTLDRETPAPVLISAGTEETSLFNRQLGTRPEIVPAAIRSRTMPKKTSGAGSGVHSNTYARIIQNWEGVVSSVGEETFQANMRPTDSENSRATEFFDIDIDNVNDGDVALLREGAKFYLTVLSIVLPGEGPQKTTRLVFRRLPRMRNQDVEDAQVEADDLWARLRPGFDAQFPSKQTGADE